MRGQATVIAFALFTIAMVFVGALFLSLVSKTAKLLDAGRREIELLTRKAREDLVISWSWDMVSSTTGYPVLLINNTGSVPVDIVQVRLSVREKDGDTWPHIVEGPWVIAGNRSLLVGDSITIKASHLLDKEQIDSWYRNNMTRILEARILTRTGNVFRSVYRPLPPEQSPPEAYILNSILFYWSAVSFMDSEGFEWWHGDIVGLLNVDRGVDGARSIDTVNGFGGIQLPRYDGGFVTFSFLVYLPRIEGGYIDLNGYRGYLIVLVEGLYDTSLPGGAYSDIWGVDLSIEDLGGRLIYSVGTGPGLIEPARYSGKALTTVLYLKPSGGYKYIWQDTYTGPINFNKTIEPGWYIFKVKVWIGDDSSFALKTIAVYIRT